MDVDDEGTISALHSLRIRSSYSSYPTPFLTEVLALDSSLFPTTMRLDDERREVIDQYQLPDTISSAAHKMNKYQSKKDMSLKRLQYLFSDVFWSLNVLGYEQ